MSDLGTWDELCAGTNCPFCQPRAAHSDHLVLVKQLSVSSLYLSREQTYRGACTLIYDLRHVVRIDELAKSEWVDFAEDLWHSECAVFEALKPDHINVESLGSLIPHLHWHIIPRSKSDGRWGGPIWTTTREEMPSTVLKEDDYNALRNKIHRALCNAI